MLRTVGFLLGAGILLGQPIAASADMRELDRSAVFGSEALWARPLQDRELAEMRGGFGGLLFSVFFNGSIENTATGSGLVETAIPDGMAVSVGENTAQIVGGLGNFGNASGVFQFTSVEGSMNVINNTMTINVAVVNDPANELANFLSSGL